MKLQTKVDLLELHKSEYTAGRKPMLIETRPALYLTISGQGPPGGTIFTEKVGALYGVAYTVKMTRKHDRGQDYAICKLEGQWWCEPDSVGLENVPVEQWFWKMMIRTPDFVTSAEVNRAASLLLDRGKSMSTNEVILELLSEGLCVQALHRGPYDREHETIRVMSEFAQKEGLEPHGRLHDIYLSDPRRMPPERLKTILRQPVRGV